MVEGTASSAELSRVITALENNKLTEQDRKAIAEKAAKNTEACACACVGRLEALEAAHMQRNNGASRRQVGNRSGGSSGFSQ